MIIHGDALEELRKLEDNSVDAICADPPAGINFMNKEFDRDRGGRDHWVAWLSSIMAEALRVLKPGGHALVWSLPRTSHWTALALEDAGFQVKDKIYHIFGQGFPKSLDVSKAAIKAGLCCTCETSDIQYLQYRMNGDIQDGTLPSMQQSPTVNASESKAEILFTNMHGDSPADIAKDQDMRDLQSRMATEGPISSSKKYDLSTMQGKEDITCKEGQVIKTSSYGDMRILHETICVDKRAQGGDILQSFMQSKSQCESPIASCQQHEGAETQESEIRRGESGMEGRRYSQESTRELQGSKVRSLPSGLSSDGAERRLCNGASLSDGSTSGEMLKPGRGSTSHRPQSEQQQDRESSTLPEQLSPQTCGRCGKKIVPNGLGTALKPATEEWILCRKPLAEKSVAANVLKFGTGALNIDATRVNPGEHVPGGGTYAGIFGNGKPANHEGHNLGRWPSHLLLSHTLLCTPEQCAAGCPVAELDEQSGIRKSGALKPYKNKSMDSAAHMFSSKIRDVQREASEGGASRYFATFRPDVPFIYSAKASRRERSEGCEALPEVDARVVHNQNCKYCPMCERVYKNSMYSCPHCNCGLAIKEVANPPRANHHPTVKAQQLMRYLVRLITPPGGVVLDMFGGSGSTAIACISEGMDYIIVEKEQEYIDIIRARVAHAEAKAKMIA